MSKTKSFGFSKPAMKAAFSRKAAVLASLCVLPAIVVPPLLKWIPDVKTGIAGTPALVAVIIVAALVVSLVLLAALFAFVKTHAEVIAKGDGSGGDEGAQRAVAPAPPVTLGAQALSSRKQGRGVLGFTRGHALPAVDPVFAKGESRGAHKQESFVARVVRTFASICIIAALTTIAALAVSALYGLCAAQVGVTFGADFVRECIPYVTAGVSILLLPFPAHYLFASGLSFRGVREALHKMPWLTPNLYMIIFLFLLSGYAAGIIIPTVLNSFPDDLVYLIIFVPVFCYSSGFILRLLCAIYAASPVTPASEALPTSQQG